MILPPVLTGQIEHGGIGQKIDGTFEQVNRMAARCWDTERKPLVAAVGFSFEVRVDTPEIGIPGLVETVQPNKTTLWWG